MWDTGADRSVINNSIVSACGLVPTSWGRVRHAQGETPNVPMYLVDIRLPNNVVVPGLTVSLGDLAGGADVLIGMDIISRGDFAVTHLDGYTKFTFRMPSKDDIDYYAEFASERERALMDQKLKADGMPGIRRRRKRG